MTPPILSDEHRAYLNAHAVSDEIIEAQGIRSEGNDIVFTWREDGKVTTQRRPWPGESGVYYWEAGQDLHLNILREPSPDAPILLAEGTKQSLAVASWAPPEYAVYGMPGCWGWTMSHQLDLTRFAGREVLIMLDADAADNLDVWDAGERLANELGDEEPPARASFVPSPAWGKDGIDDYLARLAQDRRTTKLSRLIARAQDKPADKKPGKRKTQEQIPDTGDRPIVAVNTDRRDVIREILGHMKARWDGSQLFCFGDVLTRLRVAASADGHVTTARTEPLDKDSFARWMTEAVATFKYRPPSATSPGSYEAAWPEQQTIGAMLASGDEFVTLDRLSRTPFVRPDGSVCFKNGYDPETRTVLVTGNSGMDRLQIPDSPSQADAAAAASRLLGTWLGDMPWKDEASRANALALILTPLIRGLVPLVPLAVISGLQPGVGKNLLADCISVLVTGEAQAPLPWMPDDDDENRKQITSAFRAGAQLLVFDEAHQIGGTALTRAITSITYADRILGVSKMASFPNQVTWVALGNQVTVNADMSRRTYFIDLWPSVPNPESRPETDFSITDLRGFTLDHRPELITDALVLIRAWFAAGCPVYSRGTLMGSFEAWDKITSGILGYAGVTGFLNQLAERRAEQDTTGSYWADHLIWLRDTFGTTQFRVLDVRARALASHGEWDAPPRLEDFNKEGWAREIGQAYARHADRWFGRLRIRKMGLSHGKKVIWEIEELGSSLPPVQSPVVPPQTPPIPPISDTPPDLHGRDGRYEQESRDGQEIGNSLLDRSEGVEVREVTLPPDSIRARAGAHARTRTREGQAVEELPPVPHIPPTNLVGNRLAVRADLETASSDELFKIPRGTPLEEGGFVRLAGIMGPAGTPLIESIGDFLAMLDMADRIDGHNFMGFDGLALAWHHGVPWTDLAPKIRDTELIARQVNPPRSRESGSSEDKYGLDHIAGEMGVPGKTDDLKRLKDKHGGYGQIPVDDPEYRSYLAGDLRATALVADRLMPYYDSDPYLRREHKVAALAGQMTLNGFRVDQDLLTERLEAGEKKKRAALAELGNSYGLPLTKTVMKGRGSKRHEETEEVNSPIATDAGREWLARVWQVFGITDPPVTPGGKLAIGSDELGPIAARPDCPPDLARIIELVTIVTTTRTVYQTAAKYLCPDGRVHPKNSFRQASGRWSVLNPGLTVFGKRGGKHVERDIFLPDEGHVLLSCDLSQVDMRSMAGHSQDPAYMAMFEPGRDVHSEIAGQVFGGTGWDEAGHHPRRQDAKAVGHGWNYGLGAKRMISNGMDPVMVRDFVNGMEARFPRLIEWREEIRAIGAAGELLDNGFGRRMRCEPSRAYTVAPALMGQGGARDLMCESLLHLPRELDPYLRVMVHDEIVCSVPKDCVEEIAQIIRDAMTWEWRGVPILCDMSEPGSNWGEISAK